MLARLVESLKLRYEVAITRAELVFLRAWGMLGGRWSMTEDDRHD